jgi:hypothetical protein
MVLHIHLQTSARAQSNAMLRLKLVDASPSASENHSDALQNNEQGHRNSISKLEQNCEGVRAELAGCITYPHSNVAEPIFSESKRS